MRLEEPLKNIGAKPISPNGTQVYVSQEFGGNPATYAQFGLKGHDGRDYAAPKGTPVYAAHDGFIVNSVATDVGNYGLRIQIGSADKSFITNYGHFSKVEFPEIPFNLNNEQYPVKKGDLIGLVGSTGFSTGPHLHFGLRFYENYQVKNYNNGYYGYVDPVPYMLRKNEMQVLKVNGEATLVIKNLDGKFYEVATTPELYPVVAKILGLNDQSVFDSVNRAEVDANMGGQAKAGISFISK